MQRAESCENPYFWDVTVLLSTNFKASITCKTYLWHKALWVSLLQCVDSPFKIGFQSRMELLMNTIPFLDTVAGDALSMLCTSKMILQLGAMGIRSPLARVRVLLSSSTELRFSIQMASTGPSNTSHTCSPWETKFFLGYNFLTYN